MVVIIKWSYMPSATGSRSIMCITQMSVNNILAAGDGIVTTQWQMTH